MAKTRAATASLLLGQSQKLSRLLDTVVREAAAATDPQALIDYLELTAILCDMLDEANTLYALSNADLRQHYRLVQQLADKLDTIEELIGDWDLRTQTPRPVRQSRKRARSESFDMDSDIEFAFKRVKPDSAPDDEATSDPRSARIWSSPSLPGSRERGVFSSIETRSTQLKRLES